MPALKTEIAEQRPLSEWSGLADLQEQVTAAAGNEAAISVLIASIPEGYKWSYDEANKVVEVTDDHADLIDGIIAELPDAYGGIYLVNLSSPDTLTSDTNGRTLKVYRVTANSPTETITGYTPTQFQGSTEGVKLLVGAPLTVNDKIQVERHSTENIWISGTFEGGEPVINQDKKAVLLTAKVDLSGWYWSAF